MAQMGNGPRAPKEMPSGDELRAFFDYDPASGIITWKFRTECPQKWNTRFAGKEAGCITDVGYKQIRLNGRGYRYHRIAWALFYGECPADSLIDHASGDPLDNRIENIRLASTSDNGRNSRRKDGWTLPRGVKRHHRGRLFEAQIRVSPGMRISLGTFSSADLAHAAYRAAAKQYHGEFARFD
jgi:hypothetical protein